MKKRKSILLLLVFAMVISVIATGCGGKDEKPADTGNEGEETTGEETAGVGGQITIGNTTELSGEFGNSIWQNNASDKGVRDVIYGYETVSYDIDGEFHLNDTVVEKHEEKDNEDGTKTHIFTIKEGLTYDDGTEINAEDYVAGILFGSAEAIGKMGGKNTGGSDFVGWAEYSKGETNIFKGVNLIDENTFSVTFSADKVPYFWEFATASASPFHLEFWTGDSEMKVMDDGEGAYFSKDLTEEEHGEAIEKARFAVPRPSSGPYYVESYSEADKTAVLKVNKEFKGLWDGTLPRIETLIVKKVSQDTMLDELATGSIDILPKLASGDEINAGFDLVDESDGKYTSFDYPRAGYGKLMFSCDFGPTADVEVRQAIAHLLDRNEFAKSFTGGYGSVVHGPYGEGSWFYQEAKSEIESAINEYPYDVNAAIELLEKAGWTLDENGGEYKEGIRYKKNEEGELEPLIINWASTENNEVSDLLVVSLQQNKDLDVAGMKIEQTSMDFTELLNYMYRDASQGDKYGVPTYHMYNMASNFPAIYDRKYDVTTDPELIATGWNSGRIIDEELEQLAIDNVYIDPSDRDLFVDNFAKFVVKWNEVLPELPLYSNQYYDFHDVKLVDYESSAFFDSLIPFVYAGVQE